MADQPNRAFTNVYGELYNLLNYDPNGTNVANNVVVTVGLNKPLNPDDYADMATSGNPDGSVKNAFNFAQLADTIPNDRGGNLSAVYKDIVTGANVPNSVTKSQEDYYNTEAAKLYNGIVNYEGKNYKGDIVTKTNLDWTPLYSGYNLAKDAYFSAIADYYTTLYTPDENGKLLNPDKESSQGILKQLRATVKSAYDNWTGAKKEEVERILAHLATAANDGLASLFYTAKYAVVDYKTLPGTSTEFGWSLPLQQNWLPKLSVKLKDKIEDVKYEFGGLISGVNAEIAKLNAQIAESKDKDDIAKMKSELKDLNKQVKDFQSECANVIKEIKADGQTAIVDPNDVIYSDFTITTRKTSEHIHSEENNYKAGISASWGPFSIGGEGGYHKATSSADNETSDVTITGKIARISIVRPWFNPYIFCADKWWHSAYKKGGISNGNGTGSLPLPMYATSLIIVKDLAIESKFDATHITTSESSWSSDMSIGYGPFRFGPRYSHNDKDFVKETTANGYKFTNRGYQLIGTVNAIVPYNPPVDISEASQNSDKKSAGLFR